EMHRTYSVINDRHWKALERGEITREQVLHGRYAEFLTHYGIDADPDAVNRHYLTALSACDILFEDSMDALKELSKHYRIYFVTNGNAMVQRGRFGRSPVMEYIDDYFISGEIGYEKPDMRYFEAVFARIPDFDPAQTLLAGDSPTSDLTGAIRAGLDSCYVNRRGKALPPHITPTYEVPDLASLVQLLGKEVKV
ncbi:MAG: HAD-IA family hydrolase, partial [Oscillospiraceae bacterium]|nr:HAD-IA family hydrolase [Oscillospiraceae bacterium]